MAGKTYFFDRAVSVSTTVAVAFAFWAGGQGLATAEAAEAEEAEAATVLTLAPSEGNPRNSEGDFVRLEDGRVLFVYTRFSGGGSDHDRADLVSRVSADGGVTWSSKDELVVKNEGDFNVMSVSLLRLADSRIALFYLVKNSLDDCRPVVRFSTDEAASWSELVAMISDDEIGYHVLNNDRVVQLESGRLVAPVALHNRPDWEEPDWNGEVTCYLSDDGGKTWRRSRTLQKARDAQGGRVVAQEPGVVELKDGRLLMWVRTGSGVQFGAHSGDGGETWSSFEPLGIASPRSPASIERIPSTGDLVMAWNNHADLPLEDRRNRTPFTVAVSRDDGLSWGHVRNVASDPEGWYCYTAIDFVGDHVLFGHVAGEGEKGRRLSTTRVTRIPVTSLYE
ncbi:MAG: sialidase family protein [Verrucomicrobiales bacterium]